MFSSYEERRGEKKITRITFELSAPEFYKLRWRLAERIQLAKPKIGIIVNSVVFYLTNIPFLSPPPSFIMLRMLLHFILMTFRKCFGIL